MLTDQIGFLNADALATSLVIVCAFALAYIVGRGDQRD